ncbi:hypothetical protein RIVM261_056410 [Rivularia sp. IAM M-261]|nr:hypothetical protein RIVM261_056410 [Rivularia sp. IAM M-261]
MTTTIRVVKPIATMQLEPGSFVTIPDVTWEEFKAILEELGEKRSSRVAYYQGTFEIMVPLPEHEKPKDIISDIVKILLKATRKRYEPFGSTTFKKEGAAGVEPDACFYIQNYQLMIGRRRIEANDPPPDLAIEADVTSKTTIDAYKAIGVPEVWIYNGKTLTIHLLQNNNYIKSDTSPNFPNIAITQIIPTIVERSWQVGHLQALEEFEAMIKL